MGINRRVRSFTHFAANNNRFESKRHCSTSASIPSFVDIHGANLFGKGLQVPYCERGARFLRIHDIEIPAEELAQFSRRNHIRKLSLFGSILTARFSPDSDIDVLVEFEPDHIPGFFGLTRMEGELSEIFRRKVDLRTPEELSRYFRDEVVASAAVQYEHR